jgi:ABC-type multidrug transport system fused ATPase/permease subunit
MFGWRFASIGVFHFLQAAGNIASPVMITQLTQFVINTQAPTAAPPPLWLGIIFALVLFALQLLASATLGRYFYHSSRFGMKVRSVLAAVCYRKMMRLSSLARQQYSGGRIMNMISSDLPRIESTIIQGHYMWSGPLQIAVILAILIYYIGAVALAGFALLILLIPVQALIFIRLGKLRRATASITDRRIKHTEEYFQGIKIIKLFGWELSFLNRLMEMRDAEVSKIRRVNVLTAIVMGIATSFPTFASVISFIAYAALGNALSAPIIFAALAYFSMMRAPLIILPSIIRFAVESKVAMNRLEEFLLAAEVANEFIAHSTDAASDVKDAESQQYAIVMRDCNFSYEAPPKTSPSDDDKKKEGKANGKTQAPSSPTKPTKAVEIGEKQDVELKEVKAEPKIFKLRDLNVKIKRGQLIAVVGPVGCGKTTFLNAILGEVKRESGDISVNGSIGYSLQNPWIQNGTLRKNVLFGNPFDEHRYQTVVEASALSKDLEWLPGGSDTLLGEKGVQISGGQKARVSLARLMYCSPDIALLDDPLSAVDIHVGKHIFRECIKGALSGKTIVLATHHLNYLRQCDYIIVLKDGEVREEGTFDDLMSAKGECFRLVSTFAGEETSSSATDAKAASATKANTSDSAKTDPAKPEKTTKALKMTEEERVIGSVSGAVYREYLKAAAGPMLFAMIAILIILAQCSRVGNDVWLAVWSSNRFPELGAGGYSGFYFGWGFMQGSTAAVLGVVLSFAFARASVSLHRNALQGVFVAPMKFFDTTPLGRIVNRFSRDTDTMDAQLPSALQMFISIFASLVST